MNSVWYRAALASALVVALGAGPVVAGDEKSKSPAAAGDTYKSPAASPRTGGDFTGRHTMDGEVTKVDQQKGMVSVKTAEGTLDLHFPPSALANVKTGDRVSVELALKHDTGAGASPRSESAPKR